MKFQCAFIYVAPNCDPEKQRGIIEGDDIDMNVIGCSTYEQAEAAAKEMVAKGCSAIELCAGFGNEGVARDPAGSRPGHRRRRRPLRFSSCIRLQKGG